MECLEAVASLASGEDMDEALRHAAACPACGEQARAFQALRKDLEQGISPPPHALSERVLGMARTSHRTLPARRRLVWAAAALLLAVSLLAPRFFRPPPPEGAAALPDGVPAVGSDRVLALDSDAHLEKSLGASVSVLPDGTLSIASGRIFVRAGSRPLRLSAAGLEAVSTSSAFEVRIVEAPEGRAATGFSWISPALAGLAASPAVEVAVLEGSVAVQAGGTATPVEVEAGSLLSSSPAGEAPLIRALSLGEASARLAWRDGEAAPEDLLAMGLEAWRVSGPGRAALDRGALVLDAPEASPLRLEREVRFPGRFLWTLTFVGTGGGYLEAAFPEPVRGSAAVVLGGLPELRDGREHALALRWDLAPALTLDGRVLGSYPRPAGAEGVRPVGVAFTGGSVRILSWTWKPLP